MKNYLIWADLDVWWVYSIQNVQSRAFTSCRHVYIRKIIKSKFVFQKMHEKNMKNHEKPWKTTFFLFFLPDLNIWWVYWLQNIRSCEFTSCNCLVSIFSVIWEVNASRRYNWNHRRSYWPINRWRFNFSRQVDDDFGNITGKMTENIYYISIVQSEMKYGGKEISV